MRSYSSEKSAWWHSSHISEKTKLNANSTYESIITPDNTNDKNNNYLFSRDNYLFINSKELLHNQIAVNNNFDDTFYVRVFTFVSCY